VLSTEDAAYGGGGATFARDGRAARLAAWSAEVYVEG
jgi:hypothetical protein